MDKKTHTKHFDEQESHMAKKLLKQKKQEYDEEFILDDLDEAMVNEVKYLLRK